MAFVYSGGVASQLGTLPGGTTSRATAIDNSGNIVGRSDTGSDAALHAFLYSGGVWSDFGGPPGAQGGEATAVSSGQVAGTLNDPFGGTVAFLWTAANGMTPLGALAPGGNSQAFGVNASGDVVGSSDGVAFLFHDGQMVDLATRVLSSSGWQFSQAVAINNLGQIVGTGTRDDQQHAFLLSPTSAADVPEPPAGLPIFGGILLLWISHHPGRLSRHHLFHARPLSGPGDRHQRRRFQHRRRISDPADSIHDSAWHDGADRRSEFLDGLEQTVFAQ